LEERFGVGRRSVFRDIKALLEAGVPIGGDAGEGYFIVEGYHLPPVVFSKEEAAAILTGSKLIAHWGDVKTSATFNEALLKIRSVLKYKDREFLENLEDNINIIPPGRVATQSALDLHLEELQYAVAAMRVIKITYLKAYNNTTSTREVEPLGLVNYSAKWHLIGYCRLRNALRDFRTDRIGEVTLLPDTFDKSRHPDYMEFLEATFMSGNIVEVEVSFSMMVARIMGDQKYYFGLVEEKREGDRMIMRFYTHSIDYFARWLLSYGNQVLVRSPQELKDSVRELISELAVHHQ
ncbi:MAG: YafY family protein, partial [Cyclobacteriaceae bacterium]